jgi:hypothetical protein
MLHCKEGLSSYAVVSNKYPDKFTLFICNTTIMEAYTGNINTPNTNLHILSEDTGSQFKNRFTIGNILHQTEITQISNLFVGG